MTIDEIRETVLCYLEVIGGMQAHCFTCEKKPFCNEFALVVLRYKTRKEKTQKTREEKLPL